MTTSRLRILIDDWKNHSWLHSLDFSCPDEILTEALDEFLYDYIRWFPGRDEVDEDMLCLVPQLIPVLTYRIARRLYLARREEKGPTSADSFSLLGRHIGQIEIYYSSQIGRGLKINHGSGTVIGARCRIGENCLIHQNCTLGDKNGARPSVGDNVIIYAGAMILGDISIGSNTIIGANSVVLDSCPPGSILIGSPANPRP